MGADSFTARELAAMHLPCLPTTPAKVRDRARREGWAALETTGRGGRTLAYLASTLPEDVRTALETREAPASEEAPPASVERDLDAVPTRHRKRAAERMHLLACLADELARVPSLNAAIAAVRGEHGANSVRRWWDKVAKLPRHQWLAALVPGYRPTARAAECHPMAFRYFADLCLTKSKMPEAQAYHMTRAVAEAQAWEPVPSLDSLRRRLRREVPRAVQILRRDGTKKLSALYPAQERDRSVFRALDAVCADGHRFDLRVLWPDGVVERPILLAWQDLASGDILGWRVDRTENSDLVRLSFSDVVRTWGIPLQAYLDNGRAFASKLITGGITNRFRGKVMPEEPMGILTGLGTKVSWATPEHGQAKPIERAFGDLANSISKHPAFDGAYLGRSPMHKPANYSDGRAVKLDDFLRVVDLCIRQHRERRGRRSAVCDGRSLHETFLESFAHVERRTATEAQLRTLLLAAESVRVRSATADIFLERNRYWSDALVDLAGQAVTIRFDPDNLTAGVHVYRQDGTYVTFAECREKVGFNDMAAARAHARARRTFVNSTKAIAKASQHFAPSELARLHLEAGGVDPIAAPSAKVVAPLFGHKTETIPMGPTKEERAEQSRRSDLVVKLGKPLLEQLPRRRTPLASGE